MSQPEVYVILGGVRYWIISWDEGIAMGLNPADLREVPGNSLAMVPTIPPDYTLLRERSRNEIYVVISGIRYWLSMPSDFIEIGHPASEARVVPNGSLVNIPDGGRYPSNPRGLAAQIMSVINQILE